MPDEIAMDAADVRRIAVVGAGLMGHGIALEFALAGYDVRLHDVGEGALERAFAAMRANLARLRTPGPSSSAATARPKGDADPLERITATPLLDEAVHDADVVIEAVFERLELKQEVFRALDRACPARTILASNSSSLLPSQMAAATDRPDRVLIAHYFNPPFLLPLVELVRHPATSDATVATMHALLVGVGKRPAVVQREVPGFIGNRLQMALLREALWLVEQGVATAEDVDVVVKSGFGRRLAAAGPFEIFELAGWDLVAAIAEQLSPTLASSPKVSALIRERVERGELGAKTGPGFYPGPAGAADGLRDRIGVALTAIASLEAPAVGEGDEPSG